jgi:acetolactate synthase-1/2/3 large subunit
LFDCRVDPTENCYPMIPSGAAHNDMILSALSDASVSDEGKMLV